MDRFCVAPCSELRQLHDEFRAVIGFVQKEARGRVSASQLALL